MKCKKHPKYKGINKPKVSCIDCWRVYYLKHNPGFLGCIGKIKNVD